MRIFFSALPLFLVSLVTASCSTLALLKEPPKVKFKGVRLKQTDLKNATLDIVLEVENKNDVAATVDRLKYNLMVDEKQIASGIFDQKVELPARSTSQVAVPVQVKLEDIFASAFSLLQKKGAPYNAKGTVGIGVFEIPFNESGKIEIKDL